MRLAVVAVCVGLAMAYPQGPPVGTADDVNLCRDMFPTGHGAVVQDWVAPYDVLTSTTGACFKEGQTIEIMIKVQNESYYYEGFFAQVITNNNETNYGTFEAFTEDKYTASIKCFNNDNSAIAQKDKAHFWSRKFKWTAPSDLKEDATLRYTLVKNKVTFWASLTSKLTYKADCADGTALEEAKIKKSDSHEDNGDDTSKASSNLMPALLVTMATLLFATLLP